MSLTEIIKMQIQENLMSLDSWENSDVATFYENIPAEKLREIAIKGGFDNCCDIELIKEVVLSSRSILDVGSGYGRVINYLFQNNYLGEITAIERSNNFFNYLKKHFNKKIEVFNVDFMLWNNQKKYDIVLFMWSNISEFPKNKQLLVIKKLISFLSQNGILVLETILDTLIPKNASAVFNKCYYVSSEYGNAYGYLSSVEEIKEYIHRLGLDIKTIPYITTTDRERFIHLITQA